MSDNITTHGQLNWALIDKEFKKQFPKYWKVLKGGKKNEAQNKCKRR